jgi:hypothetical protein
MAASEMAASEMAASEMAASEMAASEMAALEAPRAGRLGDSPSRGPKSWPSQRSPP